MPIGRLDVGPPGGTAAFITAATASRGLRTASIALFWCVGGGSLLLFVALAVRRSAWREVGRTGERFPDLGAWEDGRQTVAGCLLLLFLLQLAALIVLSIWSLRVGRRAREAGAFDVTPGLACGGWYIPYASAVVPFVQLRRIAVFSWRSSAPVNAWQGLYIAGWLLESTLVGMEPAETDPIADLGEQLSTQLVVGGLLAVVVLGMAVAATVAVRELDRT